MSAYGNHSISGILRRLYLKGLALHFVNRFSTGNRKAMDQQHMIRQMPARPAHLKSQTVAVRLPTQFARFNDELVGVEN
jgi:hypothetical protein